MFPQAQSEDSPPAPRAETTVRLRAVGIGQVPSEISVGSGEQNNPVAENGFVVLTPAFFRATGTRSASTTGWRECVSSGL